MLRQAFRNLPDEAINNFRLAYFYRSQFGYMAESRSAEDSGKGLVAAVIRALALGIGFKHYSYDNIQRDIGIDAISDSNLEGHVKSFEETDVAEFRMQLCGVVKQLPAYNVHTFFDSLEWAEVDCKNKVVFQKAVEESLLNYARTAMLGISAFYERETGSVGAPAVSYIRGKNITKVKTRKMRSK